MKRNLLKLNNETATEKKTKQNTQIKSHRKEKKQGYRLLTEEEFNLKVKELYLIAIKEPNILKKNSYLIDLHKTCRWYKHERFKELACVRLYNLEIMLKNQDEKKYKIIFDVFKFYEFIR